MKEVSEEGLKEEPGEFALPVDESVAAPEFFFGKMLELDSAKHDFKDLIELGNTMHGSSELNKELPAGYVFLGQFIDHDLALNPGREPFPDEIEINPATIRNARAPFLNLDSLYGGGPQVNPELYEPNTCFLKLGLTDIVTRSGIDRPFPNDLPRKPGEQRAFLADSRNGENLGIAQTHVAFIKFHNAVARGLNRSIESDDCFKEARKIVTQHYQWIVLNDFLPKIIDEKILQDVLTEGCDFYKPPNPKAPLMPVEFSAGAFRFGHSIVPRIYEWNRLIKSRFTTSRNTIVELFDNTGHDNLGSAKILTGTWIIDWRRFYDFTRVGLPAPTDDPFYTFAHKTDTLLLREFKRIPLEDVKPGQEHKLSLSIRNLCRGRQLGLPSGQEVADLFKVSRISVQDMEEKLPSENLKKKFGTETPLWYYILREAEVAEKGARLGPVGSRILAEVFVKLIELSPHSIRGAEFQGNKWQSKLMPAARRDVFEMADILNFVRERNRDSFDELNPIN